MTLSVGCYIIGKIGVTLSVDVTLLGVTLSGVTGPGPLVLYCTNRIPIGIPLYWGSSQA